MMANRSTEDYIKAVYALEALGAPVTTSAVASQLHIANGSVSAMLKKLSQERLLHYKPYQGVTLTTAGRRMALKIVRRHRLWEVFLAERLGFPWDEVHDEGHDGRHQEDEGGAVFEEMDTDAVLNRHPQLCLVDEFAHTNVPGSSRTKRWEDVKVLRDAGISIHTTMNVQHLESLNDQIREITGIRVRETIPDWVVQQADEVVIVDLSPRALIHRLERGVIYDREKVERALQTMAEEGKSFRDASGNHISAGNFDKDAFYFAKGIVGKGVRGYSSAEF